MSLLGNLFTIIPFIKNKKNAIYVIIVIVIENMNTLPHSLPPLLNNALHFWRGRTSLNKDRLGTTKGAGSFHIHRKTMKDLGILAVLGVREQPNLAHNLVTHRH